MRAALACLALAACSPEIASGSYLCGANMACPPDEACDGSDNTCVVSGTEMPFSCTQLHEPDDSAQQAFPIGPLACVSQPVVDRNCLIAGDAANWIKLTTPASCTAVAVDVRLTFPIAFETLGFELWDLDASAMLGTGSTCTSDAAVAGDSALCLTMTVQNSHSYAVAVKPAGGGDCNGACAYNRYDLTVQLATPSG